MKTFLHSILLLLLVPCVVIAETIYKSIDENGSVTYSTSPPQNSERSTSVDITPPPSKKEIEAARAQHERNKQAADTLDESRKKREQISAEENRLKRENQRQLQQKKQAEKNNSNDNYGYPYIPGRRHGGVLPPAHRPAQLPSR